MFKIDHPESPHELRIKCKPDSRDEVPLRGLWKPKARKNHKQPEQIHKKYFQADEEDRQDQWAINHKKSKQSQTRPQNSTEIDTKNIA